jgi:hypothetical protein
MASFAVATRKISHTLNKLCPPLKEVSFTLLGVEVTRLLFQVSNLLQVIKFLCETPQDNYML